jgi:hypothetical protein
MTATAAIDHHESAKADPLVVFLARCEARADLTARGLYTLQESVDKLQADAERQGLIARHGQDAAQEILAASFADVDKIGEHDPNSCDEGELGIIRRWELADPRDRWRYTGEVPPHARASEAPVPRYCTPQATIDAFKYIVGLGDREHLARWLAQHPLDARELRKIWRDPPCPEH